MSMLSVLDTQKVLGCACGASDMADEIREIIRQSPNLPAYRKAQLAELAKHLDNVYAQLTDVSIVMRAEGF